MTGVPRPLTQGRAAAAQRIVAVGCAKSKFIRPFRAETRFPHDLFCDPERAIYNHLGLISKAGMGASRSAHVKSGVVMGLVVLAAAALATRGAHPGRGAREGS